MVVDVIKRFSEKAPVAMMFRGVFARMFSKERLNEIFREHKVMQVESEILFSSVVELLTPVVAGAKSAVLASFKEHQKELGVSKQAFYDKLKGVEPEVSAALVRVPVAELARVLQFAKATHDDPVPGYHTYILDGKRLDGTEHRLEETRHLKSSPLPGTVLVLLDTRLELFVDAACHRDAYICERKVVLDILKRIEVGALYLADRNFCDGPLIDRFLKGQAFFLLRQHGRSPRWRKLAGHARRKVGRDRQGRQVWEQAIEVQLPDGSWKQVRRITLRLSQPTAKGEKELHLLTNLPETVSALVLVDAYGRRWTIETCLGYVAQALNAEINTLAYPGAALLCFCLGLVLFNVLSALRALLRAYAGKSVQPMLSYYYLAAEVAEARLGMEITIEAEYWEHLSTLPLPEFLKWVKALVRHVDWERYRAQPRGPKRPPPKRTSGKRRAHVSTQKILDQRKTLA